MDPPRRPLAGALLALLAVLALTAAAVGTMDAPRDRNSPTGSVTVLETCGEITEPGRYVLARGHRSNGTVTSTACLTVRADDVVLDGRGHALASSGASNTTAIRVTGGENVTVRNVVLRGWHRGIRVNDAQQVTLRNLTARDNAFGVSVRESGAVLIRDTLVRDNLVGLRVRATGYRHTNLTLRNNDVAVVSDGDQADRAALATAPGRVVAPTLGPPILAARRGS